MVSRSRREAGAERLLEMQKARAPAVERGGHRLSTAYST